MSTLNLSESSASPQSPSAKAESPLPLLVPISGAPAALNPEEVVRRAYELSGAIGAALALVQAGAMICRAAIGFAPPRGTHLNLENTLSGECVRSNQPVICPDPARDPRVSPKSRATLGGRGIVLLPIREGEQAAAGILVLFFSPGQSLGDVVPLSALAAEYARTLRPTPVNPPGASKPLAAPVGLRQETETLVCRAPPEQGREMPTSPVASDAIPEGPGSPPPPGVHLEALQHQLDDWQQEEAHAIRRRKLTAVTVVLLLLLMAGVVVIGLTDPSLVNREWSRLRTMVGQNPKLSPPPRVTAPSSTPGAIVRVELGDASRHAAPPEPGTVPPAIVPGKLMEKTDPVYPEQARAAQLYGDVLLLLWIDEKGSVHQVRVVRGPEPLAEASRAAAVEWRFMPYVTAGQPVSVDALVTVTFERTSPRPRPGGGTP